MRSKRWIIILVTLCVVMLSAGVGSASADDAAWKEANDTDPHVPLTAFQEQMLAQKEQAVADFFTAISGNPFAVVTDESGGDGSFAVDLALAAAPSTAYLLANQTPQQRSYWCGPAAVVEALGQLGVNISQQTAALKLGTSPNGTGWSGGPTSTGHPVPDVLNLYQQRNYYIPWSVPYSPSAMDVSNYKSFLVSNIVNPPAAPLIGDAYETSGSQFHLNGHPPDRSIWHWFDIRGYTNSGGSTMYEDSVHNAPTVSWYAGVPAYSTLPSNQIVTIVGGRGYVW
jgi:hypothetical protein